MCCSGIGWGHNWCRQKGRVDSGGDGGGQVPRNAASKVGDDGRQVRVEELVEGVYYGERGFVVDQCYHGVFEVFDELIDGGGRHGGGKKN